MADVLEKPPLQNVSIRRFELPDLDHHPWIYKRLIQAYPHIKERDARGWLKNLLYMNEFSFLFQDNAVALAQSVRPYALTPDLVIWERFVWCQNPIDPVQQAEAAQFYPRFVQWGRGQDAQAVIIQEHSDVPYEMAKQALAGVKNPPRLMERKQTYARL